MRRSAPSLRTNLWKLGVLWSPILLWSDHEDGIGAIPSRAKSRSDMWSYAPQFWTLQLTSWRISLTIRIRSVTSLLRNALAFELRMCRFSPSFEESKKRPRLFADRFTSERSSKSRTCGLSAGC
jgi:hypothetical protein